MLIGVIVYSVLKHINTAIIHKHVYVLPNIRPLCMYTVFHACIQFRTVHTMNEVFSHTCERVCVYRHARAVEVLRNW